MTATPAHVSAISGKFAHRGASTGNMPSAPFWMQLALGALRYGRRHIERAEERDPGSTGLAHFHVMRAIAELEAVFPGPRRPAAAETPSLPACASTPSALGLDG